MNGTFPVDGFIEVTAMLMLSAGLVLAMVRLVRGPSLPDRVVALDLITMLGLGMLAVYSMATGRTAYLDVGIVLTLVTFIATFWFGYFLEKGTGGGGGR